MITDPQSLNDSAAVAHSFVKKAGDALSSSWIDSGYATGSLLFDASVKHASSPARGNQPGVARHLISFKAHRLNAAGIYEVGTANLSLIVPDTGLITNTDVFNLRYFLTNFWTATNNDKILRGEV